MPDIHASAEVRQLIGAETLQRLASDAYSSYSCARCRQSGRTAQPTTVVVRRYRGDKAEVELAHADCADSGIVEIDASPPDRGRADMGTATLALGYPDEPTMRPLLLLEPRIETMGPAQGEERVTVQMAAFLRYGLTLMTSGSQLPELAEDWRLHRFGPDSARLVEARGSVVYRGPCDQPGDWAALVDAAGASVVLAGTIGLYAVPDGELTEERIRRMLDEAAHAGLLAGGIVICARSHVATLSRTEQPGELRRRIARYWRRQSLREQARTAGRPRGSRLAGAGLTSGGSACRVPVGGGHRAQRDQQPRPRRGSFAVLLGVRCQTSALERGGGVAAGFLVRVGTGAVTSRASHMHCLTSSSPADGSARHVLGKVPRGRMAAP